MRHFEYRKGELTCEDVGLKSLAEDVGTPFYVYSSATLKKHYQAFEKSFSDIDTTICFAVKSCSNIAILKLLSNMGSGADIVSGGELYRALTAGIDPKKIVYAGVGKTAEEIEYALKSDILMFNVESGQELHLIDEIAGRLNITAKVAIRVNPDIDPKTHPYISTGLKNSKFGIPIEKVADEYAYARDLDNVQPVGVHCHIGSQIADVEPFKEAAEKMVSLTKSLKKDGINIEYLDMGGGLGISYDNEKPPTPDTYADVIKNAMKGTDLKLILEPGRNIAGNAGALVTKVVYTKLGAGGHFTVADAAMNDLSRPSLYGSYHEILPVDEHDSEKRESSLVGPICESGDFLAKDRLLPDVRQDDLIAVMSAGAYGFTMSSNYNTRPRVPEILVDNNKYYIIRRRETLQDLVGPEKIPTELL